MRLPQPGELFQGKYRLERVLGRGGYATVFLAVDAKADRRLAIKVIEAKSAGYGAGVEARFMREVRVLGNLRDPHTITMFDYGQTADGLLYMVFEYVEGRDLDAVISAVGPLREADARHVLWQVLRSLREAHANGLLHRDLKPQNIMIFEYMEDAWSAKLLDFGIALDVDTKADRITKQGSIVGTPRYMAPELIYGEEASAASDIYGLGLVVYEMLVGRSAIEGETHAEMLRKQVAEEPITLPAATAVSEELRAIVERMVEKVPARRYQSVDQVLADLTGSPSSSRPPARAAAPVEVPRAADHVATVVDLPMPGGRPDGELSAGPRERSLTPVVLGMVAAVVVVAVGVAALISSDPELERDNGRNPGGSPTFIPGSGSGVEQTEPPGSSDDQMITLARLEVGVAIKVANRTSAESSPCARPGRSGKTMERHVFEGGKRTVVYYAPRTVAPKGGLAVVLMYHGQREQRPGQFLNDSGMARVADREGYVLVSPQAPESDARSLLSRPVWEDEELEVRFARHVLDDVATRFCVDPGVVYVIGHATGAEVAQRLRCELPVSAVALTSSRLRRGETLCSAEQPVPVIELWGEKDHFNNAAGTSTEGCVAAGRPMTRAEHVAAWRQTSGCGTERRAFPAPERVACDEWVECASPFVSCTHPFGVGWPSTTYLGIESMLSQCFGPPAAFDLPGLIADFFRSHGRRVDHVEDASPDAIPAHDAGF